MSYTNTAAQPGLGTVVAINTGTTVTPIWTTVGEITSVKQSGRKARTAEVTNLQSGAAEFIATLVESGSFSIDGNRVATDAGQLAVETAFSALTTKMFKATLPKTPAQTVSGDSYAFSGVIEEYNPLAEISGTSQIKYTCSVKVSNTYALTSGT